MPSLARERRAGGVSPLKSAFRETGEVEKETIAFLHPSEPLGLLSTFAPPTAIRAPKRLATLQAADAPPLAGLRPTGASSNSLRHQQASELHPLTVHGYHAPAEPQARTVRRLVSCAFREKW